jgi:hypothetical protein
VIKVLIERHEALHSLYFMRGRDPVQAVTDGRRLKIPVLQANGDTVSTSAEAVREQLRNGAYDTATELPIRAAIVATGDRATAVVIGFSHAAVDAWALAVVLDELERLLAGTAVDDLGPRARQPLDRVAFEQSDAGARIEAATLAHWKREVRATPTLFQAETPTPPHAMRDWGEIDSPAMALCARILAGKTSPSAVMIAMIGALLAHLSNVSQSAMRVIVSTRFDRSDWSFVGAMNQNAYVRFKVRANTTATQYTRTVYQDALAAYISSEADPRKVEAVTAAYGEEMDFTPQGYCFFNDTSFSMTSPTAEATSDSDLSDIENLLGGTRIRHLDREGRQLGAKFFVFLQDMSSHCRLTLCRDPAFLDLTACEFLACLERFLVLAASRPDADIREILEEIAPVADSGASLKCDDPAERRKE